MMHMCVDTYAPRGKCTSVTIPVHARDDVKPMMLRLTAGAMVTITSAATTTTPSVTYHHHDHFSPNYSYHSPQRSWSSHTVDCSLDEQRFVA
eukprot:27919-Eustigmatos_ZCMA.PRE.1